MQFEIQQHDIFSHIINKIYISELIEKFGLGNFCAPVRSLYCLYNLLFVNKFFNISVNNFPFFSIQKEILAGINLRSNFASFYYHEKSKFFVSENNRTIVRKDLCYI
jgi:hypothetical protein